MTRIRAHDIASAAYECVDARRSDDKKKEYGALAHRLPGMILQNGLAQATGFLRAKGKQEHRALLDDLNAVLQAAKVTDTSHGAALHQKIIESDLDKGVAAHAPVFGGERLDQALCAGRVACGCHRRANGGRRRLGRRDMMTTELIREKLRTLYEEAGGAHPGLLLQRGLPEHQEGENGSKTNHIKRVCKLIPDDFYRNAYKRWRKATSDKQRFHQVRLVLENRLFIGLTGGGMLETGCAICHSYGTPYIPGSSIKGVVLAHAREGFDTAEGKAVCDELFGAPATENRPAGLSGLITFHDAWWVPDSAKHPLVQEVVTSHHPDYYGEDGKEPATDFDSPVPNAQVAVQGAFLFTIEGPVAWLPLAEDMLIAALSTHGIGAKTRAGYGTMKLDPQ